MKKLAILLFTISLSFQGMAQSKGDTIISNDTAKLKLKVLYFHVTNRCNTCRSIEAAVRKTIKENFQSELDSGIVALYVINCELPENKVISQKYDAYGATLAVTKMFGGKEATEDLTNFAFSKIHDEDIFINDLKIKITELLK